MKKEEMDEIFRQARDIDPTLKIAACQRQAMLERRLAPQPFSRQALYGHMRDGEPFLATGLKVPVRGEERLGKPQAVLRALIKGLSPTKRFSVRQGKAERSRRIGIEELVRLWRSNRSKVTVTDLHIRNTWVLRYMNCKALSDFNLLPRTAKEMASEEILSMVVSSTGTVTDSHTDDHDGSNHCFTGRKLWLVWDTFTGMQRGIEDCSRCDVKTVRGAFEIKTFLSISGARWFVVEPGQTLFLPGHMAHKVITLERYLGVGSFFVMLPSFLRTLERWMLHTPLWVLDLPKKRQIEQSMDLIDQITERVLKKAAFLSHASRSEQEFWGLDHLVQTVKALQSNGSKGHFVTNIFVRLPSRKLYRILLHN
jgi:hypothetical protein